MEDRKICHEKDREFQKVILGCLESGLPVLVEGELLTVQSLSASRLVREEAGWEACCLRDENGQLLCLDFHRKTDRNTLLPNSQHDPSELS
jgi:hypothetical protein